MIEGQIVMEPIDPASSDVRPSATDDNHVSSSLQQLERSCSRSLRDIENRSYRLRVKLLARL